MKYLSRPFSRTPSVIFIYLTSMVMKQQYGSYPMAAHYTAGTSLFLQIKQFFCNAFFRTSLKGYILHFLYQMFLFSGVFSKAIFFYLPVKQFIRDFFLLFVTPLRGPPPICLLQPEFFRGPRGNGFETGSGGSRIRIRISNA